MGQLGLGVCTARLRGPLTLASSDSCGADGRKVRCGRWPPRTCRGNTVTESSQAQARAGRRGPWGVPLETPVTRCRHSRPSTCLFPLLCPVKGGLASAEDAGHGRAEESTASTTTLTAKTATTSEGISPKGQAPQTGGQSESQRPPWG